MGPVHKKTKHWNWKASHTCHLHLPVHLTGFDLDRHIGEPVRGGGGGEEEVSETAWMSVLLLLATGLWQRLYFLRMRQEAQLSVESLRSLFRDSVRKHPDALCNNMETADRATLQRCTHKHTHTHTQQRKKWWVQADNTDGPYPSIYRSIYRSIYLSICKRLTLMTKR